MRINKKYQIVEATCRELIGAIFECVIINKGENVPPKWFKDFEKKNDTRWAKQEVFNRQQTESHERIDDFIKQQLEFNKLMLLKWEKQEEFNKYVLDVFKRNNLK